MHRIINETQTGVVVTAANTTIIEEDVVGYHRIFVELRNTGANSLSAFSVVVTSGPQGHDLVLYSSSADFTTPAGTLIGTSSDLTALTAANTGWLELDTTAYWRVKLIAQSTDGTTIIPYGTKMSL